MYVSKFIRFHPHRLALRSEKHGQWKQTGGILRTAPFRGQNWDHV